MSWRETDENDGSFQSLPRLTLSAEDKAKMLKELKSRQSSIQGRRYPGWRARSLTALAATAAVACVAGLVIITKSHSRTPESAVASTVAGDLKQPTELQTYHGKTFTANILLVRNPKRIKVGVTKHVGTSGETVSELVQDAGALGGVNGGAFGDAEPASNPLGITIHDGKVLGGKPSLQPEIGFTQSGQLVCGSFTAQQLTEMHVTEAVSFGPILVQDGKGMVTGDGGAGYSPRTAIGQRGDGTVIFIVTDGRMRSGLDDLGASLKDLQELMLKYGAVTAANLDGGSSSTMVYQGHLVNQPSNLSGERKVPTAFLIAGES